MLLHNLNPEQREAVLQTEGPVLIIAGAGSGKTRVITHRIAHMIDSGTKPENILALTFTNKAATEMAERVRLLIGAPKKKRKSSREGIPMPTIGTFHAFGLSMLRRYGRKLGYRQNFSVYDSGDQFALLKEAARDIHVNPDELELLPLLNAYSGIKTGRLTWNDEVFTTMLNPDERGLTTFRDLYQSYQEHLLVFNAVDFDDLIVRPLHLLTEHAEILEYYEQRYSHVLVDEFQDTSTIQYELLRLLAKRRRNVCVVGDDDQSIYSWRGADFRNIQAYERDFPEVKEIRLERNYRSTGQILSAANSVIANNRNRKDKKLWTSSEDGARIELSFPEDDTAEANFIAQKIKILSFQHELRYEHFGILIRTNGQARAIEEALLSEDIPYRMSGGQSFFQRKEIKDVIGYLRVILNPDDDVNMLRIINTPRRGIGRRSLEQLQRLAEPRKQSLLSTAREVIHGQIPHELGKSAVHSLTELSEMLDRFRYLFFGDGDPAGADGESGVEGSHKRSISAATEKLVHDINYWGYLVLEYQKNDRAAKAKWRNIALFIKSIASYEHNPDVFDPTLLGYLNRISLQTRDENDDDNQGKVHLMTIHAAKGLEHEVVFLAGVEQDLLPHRRSTEEAGTDEEERRLFYVAITRARRQLYMTSCRRRMVMREMVESSPSPFLEEIPEELIQIREADASAGSELPSDPFAALKSVLGT